MKIILKMVLKPNIEIITHTKSLGNILLKIDSQLLKFAYLKDKILFMVCIEDSE